MNVIFSRGVVDAQVPRQTKGAHTVNQAKVNDLGVSTLLGGHRVETHVKDLRSCCAVDVQALQKRANQGRVFTQVRHDAQLNLGVICAGNQAPLRRHEGFTHPPTLCGADRDVLQVGIITRQTPRHSNGLGIVGVHAPRLAIGQTRKLVGVGAFQLGQAAVLKNARGQGVIGGELLQHLFVGTGCTTGGLLDHG